MPNEQKTGYVASKRDLAKTENNSSMTKPVATVTNSTTDLSSIKQQGSSKITVSIYKVILISILDTYSWHNSFSVDSHFML